MIQSMTGYGKAVVTFNDKKINVEIRSLNSKTLDLSTRIAPLYREKEIEMRQMVAKALTRGKVDFSIWVDKDAAVDATPINGALVENYYRQITELSAKAGIPEPLQKKFEEKLQNIAKLMADIEPYEKARVEKIRTRIVDALKDIPEVDYDKNRLEQELIYYIEKLDISEEKQRLANHLKYFAKTMTDENEQGKKLGFIAQEMGREINTTGSKSNQAEMQNIVVMMKDELEQIKEQVLNVL